MKNKAPLFPRTKPVFQKGDKVFINGREEPLTIKGCKHTGYSWLYAFDEIEIECDRYAITKKS